MVLVADFSVICFDTAFCSFCHVAESSIVSGLCAIFRKVISIVTLFFIPLFNN